MKNRQKIGKVVIVGAGPGDPDLITVKGAKALKKADCVLYDFLSNMELLKLTKKGCERICVGKKDGLHLLEQRVINRLLFDKVQGHQFVVRLKGGDPFIFSRGAEEAGYLARKGVEVEIVPGITSAIAAPESWGIPLTVKNKISSVAVVTGRKKDRDAPVEAPSCETLIYLMGVANIGKIVQALKKSGRIGTTPCAFVERGTHPDSRLLVSTLDKVEQDVRRKKIVPPAVLIVGDVVRRRIKDHGKKSRQGEAE